MNSVKTQFGISACSVEVDGVVIYQAGEFDDGPKYWDGKMRVRR